MKVLCTIFILSISLSLFSQKSFERIDSIPKTKEQIFSDTKLFIIENWETLNVIQNEDRETGLISILTTIVINHCYEYSFTINFQMKASKYRLVISNIHPEKRICNGTSQYSPIVCEGCEFPGSFKAAMYEKEWVKVQQEFPIEMNKILTAYDAYLRKESTDW